MNFSQNYSEQNKDNQDEIIFSIDEFTPEIYDCEADGGCASGHVHYTVK